MNNLTKKRILIAAGVFLVFLIGSLVLFNGSTFEKVTGGNISLLGFSNNNACPLNGALYSSADMSAWEKRRPLGIMIENSTDARPQSGISKADVIYEAPVEAGITRFFTEFYCQDAGIVGPIRSARTYFLDFASEYGNKPLYTHVGGANCDQATGSGCANGAKADALGQIQEYGWAGVNDLSQFTIGAPTFYRDYNRLGSNVATEHTMYSNTSSLWNYAADKRNLTNVDANGTSWTQGFVPYSFQNDASVSLRPASQTVHVSFLPRDTDYDVTWTYNKASNTYKRVNGGVKHTDRDTGQQIAPKTVVVLYMVMSYANDGYPNNEHLLFADKGTGKAEVFMNGKEIKGTWEKDSRTARTIIYDDSGKQVSFVRGQLWFQIVPTIGTVAVR